MSEPTPPTGPDDPFGPQGGTSLLERTETDEQVEPGDHERFAHYVRKEKIMESAMTGKPVIALCGKVWVPGRDPNKFPVCPICKEVYDGLREPQDGDGGSGGGGGGGRGFFGFGRGKGSGSGTGGA
ncbi:DUF3039 domain-containing protein [Cellulomonas xiejunii]|uniref:DUF3039 domain-containing protein n=1 Tax=Cellulomonas xiejunii TaxID=2968083 RepID=A0ABY5KTN9_9CELL|nr:DUF3039 domain-containing protein [Cellulomonas xiejunii]MCC2315727.1 DUF3039 domain-containing protein [Cellulomonas xiejunii]MCC2321791.1 DUF3039 domain-containing protein [Cellulomonas xiejunii]UUI73098.1 DUF3039 domain-containing protein [Cellulomonas xiejunii]